MYQKRFVGMVVQEKGLLDIFIPRTVPSILFSNDGLVFATYNHYRSFYEIMGVSV